jgi:molybdenum cofactor biosynthesis enzyme MoaA
MTRHARARELGEAELKRILDSLQSVDSDQRARRIAQGEARTVHKTIERQRQRRWWQRLFRCILEGEGR